MALVGTLTDKALRSYYVDKAIVSSKGIDLEAGFTDSDERHGNNKLTMLGCANKKIVAVDSSKFEKIAFFKIGDLKDIDIIVTDKKPDMKWLQKFEELHVECIYAE